MALKILHCADVHLDSVFSFLSPELAAVRREDLRGAISKIVLCANESAADMLIISGDLFDSENVSYQTLNFVKNKLKELGKKDVYICAGNHDPKTYNSYLSIADLGENVHVFSDNIEMIEKDDYDIYGVSFSEPVATKSFLEGFKVKNPDKINIFVMHGDFNSKEYNLITKSQLEGSGIDYLALGHIHKHELLKAGKCTAVYPGCPEGRGFDETGEKGVVIATVTKDGSTVEFVPIARRKHHEIRLDITGVESYEEIYSELSGKIDNENDLYKAVLTGETSLNIDCDVIKDNINAFFIKVCDETEPEKDWEQEAERLTLKGLYIKRALEEIEKSDDSELARLSFKIGINAINGR